MHILLVLQCFNKYKEAKYQWHNLVWQCFNKYKEVKYQWHTIMIYPYPKSRPPRDFTTGHQTILSMAHMYYVSQL